MKPRILLPILGIALIIASCAPRHSKDMQQVDALRAQADSLLEAQALMQYDGWAYGAPSNQDSLYRAYPRLFTRENIDLVARAENEETDTTQKRRLHIFRRYLTTEFIAKETAPLTDRTNNIEASATVRFDGKEIPYRQVPGMLANEKSQARRAGLYAASDTVLDTLNAILSETERIRRNLSAALGYSSFTKMFEALYGFSPDQTGAIAERVLASTDSLYQGLLQEVLKKYLALDTTRFYRYDIAPVFRSRQFDRYFTGASMMKTVEATYAGLGVDIAGEKNLLIDDSLRPAKNPRAVCFTIRVPQDIRLSIKPIGGFDDYSALFHEMGHAQHYANTQENAFEFKYLGEPTVTESYAFLSEYILVNQAWLRLRETIPTPVLKDFVRFQAFTRLFFVRRYCAKLLYELQLHAGADNLPRLYATLTDRAVGCIVTAPDEKRYLVDVDDNYYSASYLRAWFLEAQLNQKLTNDYRVNWFEDRQAGTFLRSLWARGDRLNGDDLAHLLGHDAITPDAWLGEIKMMVLFSTR